MTYALLVAYPRTHWTGLQGLAWSFWVNLVALQATISVAQSLFVASRAQDAPALQLALVTVWIATHLTVFVWQVGGVLRAAGRHLRQLGSVTSTWGAQLGILIALLFTLSDIWSVWLMAAPSKGAASLAEKIAGGHAAKYSLQLSDDKKTLIFLGEISPGATKSVAAILAASPDIGILALTSNGGNIFEARGLAKLARDARLITVAVDMCSSACTIAFIGGASRRLAPGARLGFHQYRVDATYDLPFLDPLAEQERDLQLFRESGVAVWFLERMFHKRSENIWHPSAEELQRAGVLVSN